MELIFATNNAHKIDEIRSVLPPDLNIRGLKESGILIDIPEPYESLRENAFTKAETIRSLTGKSCFSEDTGLEVDALGGAPGVRSARYAGETATSDQNVDKLLHALEGRPDRGARFRTVICLLLEGEAHYFEGVCEGEILAERRGGKGFGYDPVFRPAGAEASFAEMSREEKNRYSHRGKAVSGLVAFLNNLTSKKRS